MFKAIYFVGWLGIFSVRLWYRWRARNNQIVVSRKDALEMALLALAFVGIVLVPLLYVLTSLLDFADYSLPPWAGWMGTGILAAALWLLWRSHADLGRNWSATLEVRQGHQLIVSGVYTHVRHPMYAAIMLWGLAQSLLLHNWIAGWSHVVSFLILYALRVPREERMMREQFGDAYRSYMERTGRIIPRLSGKQPFKQRIGR